MKKLFSAILTVAILTLSTVPVFAATTPYACPNGNIECEQNGACLTDGTCINHETCVENGVCQYPQGCPNGGVPKGDGTGSRNEVRGGGHGGGHGRGNGAGHCGGGRNR